MFTCQSAWSAAVAQLGTARVPANNGKPTVPSLRFRDKSWKQIEGREHAGVHLLDEAWFDRVHQLAQHLTVLQCPDVTRGVHDAGQGLHVPSGIPTDLQGTCRR